MPKAFKTFPKHLNYLETKNHYSFRTMSQKLLLALFPLPIIGFLFSWSVWDEKNQLFYSIILAVKSISIHQKSLLSAKQSIALIYTIASIIAVDSNSNVSRPGAPFPGYVNIYNISKVKYWILKSQKMSKKKKKDFKKSRPRFYPYM